MADAVQCIEVAPGQFKTEVEKKVTSTTEVSKAPVTTTVSHTKGGSIERAKGTTYTTGTTAAIETRGAYGGAHTTLRTKAGANIGGTTTLRTKTPETSNYTYGHNSKVVRETGSRSPMRQVTRASQSPNRVVNQTTGGATRVVRSGTSISPTSAGRPSFTSSTQKLRQQDSFSGFSPARYERKGTSPNNIRVKEFKTGGNVKVINEVIEGHRDYVSGHTRTEKDIYHGFQCTDANCTIKEHNHHEIIVVDDYCANCEYYRLNKTRIELALAFYALWYGKVEQRETEIIEREVEVPVYIEKVVEVIKEVEVPVREVVTEVVERTIEVPIEVVKVIEVERIVEVPIESVIIKEIEKIVEKPVEVIQYVQVPMIQEKLVEGPERIVEIEKIIEVPIDRIVIQEVEKIVEVPIEVIKNVVTEVPYIVEQEKIVEIEKIIERPIEIIQIREVIKEIEIPVEKLIEVQVPVVSQKVVEVEKIVEVPFEKVVHVESIREVPVHSVEVQVVERIVEVPVERIQIEKVVEDRLVEHQRIETVQVEVEKPIYHERIHEVEREIEVPVQKLVETIKEVPIFHDRITEVEKIIEHPVEIYSEKVVTVDRIIEKPVENTKIQVVERVVEVPVEYEIIKEVDRIVERPVTQIKIETVETIVEVPVEMVKVVEVEKPFEVVRYDVVEVVVEKPVEHKVIEIVKERIEVPVEHEYIQEVDRIIERPVESQVINTVTRNVEVPIEHVNVDVVTEVQEKVVEKIVHVEADHCECITEVEFAEMWNEMMTVKCGGLQNECMSKDKFATMMNLKKQARYQTKLTGNLNMVSGAVRDHQVLKANQGHIMGEGLTTYKNGGRIIENKSSNLKSSNFDAHTRGTIRTSQSPSRVIREGGNWESHSVGGFRGQRTNLTEVNATGIRRDGVYRASKSPTRITRETIGSKSPSRVIQNGTFNEMHGNRVTTIKAAPSNFGKTTHSETVVRDLRQRSPAKVIKETKTPVKTTIVSENKPMQAKEDENGKVIIM